MMTSPPPGPIPADAAMVASAVSRSFEGEPAVDRLDLTVRRGEVHAVVGLNGAGKTTLMRLFLGMLRPDSGRVFVLGRDTTDAPAAVWRRVGHMIEAPFAYPELTARESLYAAARLHGLGRGEAPTAVDQVVEELKLSRWADRRCTTLSLGNRQRVGLGSAIVHRPDVLVLDEPTNALDPAGVVLVRDLLRGEADRRGMSVLVSSHHLDELARIADRITVLHRGRIVGSLDPAGIDLERQFFALVHTADTQYQET